MGNNYNSLSQEKFDKFIDFLIDKGLVQSKSEFAKKMKLDEFGFNDKQILNNRIFREKELKFDVVFKASSEFKISPYYFYDDNIPVSNNPLKEHKLESIIIKELADNINSLNEKFNSFMKKTNSEKGEVLDAFKKDAKNLIDALNEATYRFILVMNKTKVFVNEENPFAKFLNIDEINSYIKNTKEVINNALCNLNENYSNTNLFKEFLKLRDEYFMVDNFRYVVIILEKTTEHFSKINQNLEINDKIKCFITMYEKKEKLLKGENLNIVFDILDDISTFKYIIQFYVLMYTKNTLEKWISKFYNYNMILTNDFLVEIQKSFKLDELDQDVDYKKVYEKSYNLILNSISNEEAIFTFIEEFDCKINKAISILEKLS